MEKKCPTCQITKPVKEFESRIKYCLDCHRIRNKKWREENREKWLESLGNYNKKRNQPGYETRQKIRRKKWKPRVVGTQHISKARQFLLEIKKQSKCAKCGEGDYRCLHFHHVLPKRWAISTMATSGFKIRTIKNEMKRCIVLCANCHAKEHCKDGAGR